jgi:hypothetical protein
VETETGEVSPNGFDDCATYWKPGYVTCVWNGIGKIDPFR